MLILQSCLALLAHLEEDGEATGRSLADDPPDGPVPLAASEAPYPRLVKSAPAGLEAKTVFSPRFTIMHAAPLDDSRSL
jgi:hypothetical protein